METAGYTETTVIHGVTSQKTVCVMILFFLLFFFISSCSNAQSVVKFGCQYSFPPFPTISRHSLPRVLYPSYLNLLQPRSSIFCVVGVVVTFPKITYALYSSAYTYMLLTWWNQGDKIGWTRSMGKARYVHVWSQILKRRDYWGDLGLDDRIILKCIVDTSGSGWTRYRNFAFYSTEISWLVGEGVSSAV